LSVYLAARRASLAGFEAHGSGNGLLRRSQSCSCRWPSIMSTLIRWLWESAHDGLSLKAVCAAAFSTRRPVIAHPAPYRTGAGAWGLAGRQRSDFVNRARESSPAGKLPKSWGSPSMSLARLHREILDAVDVRHWVLRDFLCARRFRQPPPDWSLEKHGVLAGNPSTPCTRPSPLPRTPARHAQTTPCPLAHRLNSAKKRHEKNCDSCGAAAWLRTSWQTLVFLRPDPFCRPTGKITHGAGVVFYSELGKGVLWMKFARAHRQGHRPA